MLAPASLDGRPQTALPSLSPPNAGRMRSQTCGVTLATEAQKHALGVHVQTNSRPSDSRCPRSHPLPKTSDPALRSILMPTCVNKIAGTTTAHNWAGNLASLSSFLGHSEIGTLSRQIRYQVHSSEHFQLESVRREAGEEKLDGIEWLKPLEKNFEDIRKAIAYSDAYEELRCKYKQSAALLAFAFSPSRDASCITANSSSKEMDPSLSASASASRNSVVWFKLRKSLRP